MALTETTLHWSITIFILSIFQWLKKVAEASRNKKTLKDDPDAVDMEEMNPLWLKDKGM